MLKMNNEVNEMIYADNAATTKTSKKAIDEMVAYMESCYGNPSSLYEFGQEAKVPKFPAMRWCSLN